MNSYAQPIIEFETENTEIFMDIARYAKSVRASSVYIEFKKMSVEIIVTDQQRFLRAATTFDSSDMKTYYCYEQMGMDVSLENFTKGVYKVIERKNRGLPGYMCINSFMVYDDMTLEIMGVRTPVISQISEVEYYDESVGHYPLACELKDIHTRVGTSLSKRQGQIIEFRQSYGELCVKTVDAIGEGISFGLAKSEPIGFHIGADHLSVMLRLGNSVEVYADSNTTIKGGQSVMFLVRKEKLGEEEHTRDEQICVTRFTFVESGIAGTPKNL
jgi:hypothetical protein